MLVDAVLAAKPGADEEFKAVTINLDRDDNNMKYNTEGRNAVTQLKATDYSNLQPAAQRDKQGKDHGESTMVSDLGFIARDYGMGNTDSLSVPRSGPPEASLVDDG